MKDSVIAEVKIYPLGSETAGVSHIVAACVSILEKATDISYQVTPMATIVEGPLDRILELVKEMHELPFSQGINRVVTGITIDDRRDKLNTMDGKVKAVKDKIQG
jgi:uncharacterized protein (TIGR00106 family)